MERGWVKVWRKSLDNPYFGNPKYVALWIHILMLATHKEIDMIFDRKRITLKPGQFITGRKSLKARSGIAESTIERLLETMESEHQIGQQKTTKNRLITVLNWDKYQKDGQPSGQQTDNKRTTSGHKQEQKNVRTEEVTTNNIASPTAPQEVSKKGPTPLQVVVNHFFDLQGLDPSQRSVAYPRHVRDGQALLKASGGDPEKAKGVLDALQRWASSKKLSYTIGTALKQWQRFSSSAPTESYESKMARVQAEIDKYTQQSV